MGKAYGVMWRLSGKCSQVKKKSPLNHVTIFYIQKFHHGYEYYGTV